MPPSSRRERYALTFVARNEAEMTFFLVQGEPLVFHGEAGKTVLRGLLDRDGLASMRLEPWVEREAPPDVR